VRLDPSGRDSRRREGVLIEGRLPELLVTPSFDAADAESFNKVLSYGRASR